MVLVTGGSGLLGNQLITQLLAQGRQVKALYHKTPLAHFNTPNLIPFNCNILDVVTLEEAMKGVDEVYHCAAKVSFNTKDKLEMFKINIEGTANVVNAALDAGIKKMLHVSSVAALGRTGDNELITESINWTKENNSSHYGQSKYLSELEVWRGIGEGLNAVIVNPTIILGAGNWEQSSSQIFKTVYNQLVWYTTGVAGFVDVQDVAKAMIQLMQSPITAQRFILCAANKTYQDIFTLIAKAFNKKPPYKKVTPLIAKIVWRIQALKSAITKSPSLITKETAQSALEKNYFDNSKLLKYLPHFVYKPIEETIVDTCEVFKKNIEMQKNN